MEFIETALPGVWVIEPERLEDERGFFARTFDSDAFAARGLASNFPHCSISFNRRAGTLRGMHLQAPPHAEVKVVRCTSGAVFDVVLDMRPGSPTFRRWVAVELTAQNRRMIYVPEGLAHGYQTLSGDAELFYQISAVHAPSSARGFRWDDPAFAIRWPEVDRRVIAERDRSYPDFRP